MTSASEQIHSTARIAQQARHLLKVDKKKRVLVTGANGFLGTKVVNVLKEHFEVIPTDVTGDFKANITNFQEVLDLFERTKPDIIVHTAAMTNVDGCEIEKTKAYQANVVGTKNIVECCEKFSSWVVYISTDFVFDGVKGSYKEGDEKNPVSYYGMTKAIGEDIIISSRVKHTILRIAMLYGYNSESDKTTFFKWCYNGLKEGKELNLVNDQFGCPTLIDDIALALKEVIKNKIYGLYHLTGPERLSVYEFGLKIKNVFNLPGTIRAVDSSFLKQIAKRPVMSDLNTDKIKHLGIKMRYVEEGLTLLKSELL